MYSVEDKIKAYGIYGGMADHGATGRISAVVI
jgi:hypothetical protein